MGVDVSPPRLAAARAQTSRRSHSAAGEADQRSVAPQAPQNKEGLLGLLDQAGGVETQGRVSDIVLYIYPGVPGTLSWLIHPTSGCTVQCVQNVSCFCYSEV